MPIDKLWLMHVIVVDLLINRFLLLLESLRDNFEMRGLVLDVVRKEVKLYFPEINQQLILYGTTLCSNPIPEVRPV